MENLLARVLERFTDRMILRQRALYAEDAPFIEKWRTAMRYLDDDREYQRGLVPEPRRSRGAGLDLR